jgi:ABC-type uncharacterized transport system substrate-binding protein
MRLATRASIALLFVLVPALDLYAHPHVFISSLVAVDFEGPSLSRISVEWTFDELFSQMIAADYDRGKKGSFTEAEAAALKKGAFDNLRNYHYCLALYLNGKSLALPAIRDFKPALRAGKLVYSFSLPLALPIRAAGSELRITIYDDSYYVAFDKMSPSDVAVRSGDSIATAISIEKTKVKAEWPGQFMPDQIVLRMKRK